MSFKTVTDRYLGWVAKQMPLDRKELDEKDRLMAQGEFTLLRGTFYRWAQQFPKRLPALAKAPVLLAVGDLHVENFGTWRDCDGRLAWGVNDFDDCGTMPYTVDLVRLATSAILAVEGGTVEHNRLKDLGRPEICKAILDGYADGLESPQPLVLAERHSWLRDLALSGLTDRSRGQTRYERFYETMASLRPAGPIPAAAERLIRKLLPSPAMEIHIGHRVAGIGSLGRPRFTAVAPRWNGGIIVRETKPTIASAWAWVAADRTAGSCYARIVASAVRAPDLVLSAEGGWVARRLGPDTGRVELADMPPSTGAELLQAMGKETANIHSGSRRAVKSVQRHLGGLEAHWLEQATHVMLGVLKQDLDAHKADVEARGHD